MAWIIRGSARSGVNFLACQCSPDEELVDWIPGGACERTGLSHFLRSGGQGCWFHISWIIWAHGCCALLSQIGQFEVFLTG